MGSKFLREFMSKDDDFLLEVVYAEDIMTAVPDFRYNEHCLIYPLSLCAYFPFHDDDVCGRCYFNKYMEVSFNGSNNIRYN
jgi:hypothetical protein